MTETKLLFADALGDATKFCTTFARANVALFPERGFIPLPDDDTATISFVEFDGRTFAVTAKHVIEGFDNQARQANTDPEGYFLPSAPGTLMNPPFVFPQGRLGYRDPDVAIKPIDPSIPLRARRKVYRLEDLQPSFPVAYAMAVGFPTKAKSPVRADGGDRVQMIGVVAVAEGVGSSADSDQVQFYSEVDTQGATLDVSGMSGGPVFWSDGERHGLLGFVKEAMAATASGAGKGQVHFICQRASYETFGHWAQFVETEFPKAVNTLNDRIAARNRR